VVRPVERPAEIRGALASGDEETSATEVILLVGADGDYDARGDRIGLLDRTLPGR